MLLVRPSVPHACEFQRMMEGRLVSPSLAWQHKRKNMKRKRRGRLKTIIFGVLYVGSFFHFNNLLSSHSRLFNNTKTDRMDNLNNQEQSTSNEQSSSTNSNPNAAASRASESSARENMPLSMISATATMTITETRPEEADEVLPLTLRPAPQVRWEEGVIDNEGLGRKSSKRCCIFHKQRPFGESSTDSSEDDDGNNSDGSSSSGGPGRKPKQIARKKNGSVKPDRVPDSQRFHA